MKRTWKRLLATLTVAIIGLSCFAIPALAEDIGPYSDDIVYSFYDGYDSSLIGASTNEVVYPSFPYRENITYLSWVQETDTSYYATYEGYTWIVNGALQSSAPTVQDGKILVNGEWEMITNTSTSTSGNAYGTIYETSYTSAPIPVARYTVTFTDGFGSVISTQTVEEGDSATDPGTPTHTGYTFQGWSASYSNITADTTIDATWSVNVYSVLFLNTDGSVYSSQRVQYGGSAKAPTNPARSGYIFKGWSGTYTNITQDTTLSPVWEKRSSSGGNSGGNTGGGGTTPATKTYTVTFTDGYGNVLKVHSNIKSGAAALAPKNPQRPGYSFVGWDKSFKNVTSDMTVSAIWKTATNTAGTAQTIRPQQNTTARSGNTNTEKTDKEKEEEKEEKDEDTKKVDPAEPGDTSMPALYLAMLFISAVGVLVLARKKEEVK